MKTTKLNTKEWLSQSQLGPPARPSTLHLQSHCRYACAADHLGDGHGSRARARERLDSQDLEVEVLVGEAVLGPGREVVGGGDGTRGTLALPDGPVLGEGGGTGDRGLVGASVGALDVGGTVGLDGTKLGHARTARVEAAVALDDVVLGLGAVDPAVDGEVRTAAAGLVVTRVGDLPDGT